MRRSLRRGGARLRPDRQIMRAWGASCIEPTTSPMGETVGSDSSVDNLNDPMGRRIDQYCPIVDYGITISGNAVFARDFIVGNTRLRQILADPDFMLVAIRGNVPLRDVAAETRARIVGNAAGNSADAGSDGRSNRSTDDRASYGACSSTCRGCILSVRGDRKR